MALLHYLCARAAEGGFCVAAVHVEHGIRGEASLKDAEYAEAYCREQKIPFYRYAVRARELAEREKLSLEAAARRLRYACFEAALTEKKCDFVALAHHTGDQAETVLMNLLRGAGMRGAGGMAPVRGRYLRPFLGVTKAEIAAYLTSFRSQKRRLQRETVRFVSPKICPIRSSPARCFAPGKSWEEGITPARSSRGRMR